MNEQAQASQICRHLDQATEQLSYRVQERLAAARAAAIGKVPVAQPETGPELPPIPREKVDPAGRGSWGWRFAAVAAPLLLLAGMFVADAVHEEQSVAELAEVDAALLTDDVPLVAYADHGFGVYIKNSRR
jgi:hypothetical protein